MANLPSTNVVPGCKGLIGSTGPPYDVPPLAIDLHGAPGLVVRVFVSGAAPVGLAVVYEGKDARLCKKIGTKTFRVRLTGGAKEH